MINSKIHPRACGWLKLDLVPCFLLTCPDFPPLFWSLSLASLLLLFPLHPSMRESLCAAISFCSALCWLWASASIPRCHGARSAGGPLLQPWPYALRQTLSSAMPLSCLVSALCVLWMTETHGKSSSPLL